MRTMDESNPPGTAQKALSPAAVRALAEAQARREAIDARAAEIRREREINGRGGLEPVRYEDWEVKGLATDF
ncbi:DUF1674 domain-containing protein [Methylobacterium oryzisoli]|uniref:DUF1674 domain-containing protein n=1 Tax=Methylobacterium oryzisoli TaxID=3385502 RepID=UPI00389252C0